MVNKEENTLLFSSAITGGTVLWQEDITVLNRLNREINESIDKLKAANSLLMEEEKIKRILFQENERTQLMAQLEKEIAEHTARLNSMIEQFETARDKPKAKARIILLLAYIKRRCNLFFRERETEALPVHELLVYLDEISEIGGLLGVRIKVTGTLKDEKITVRHLTLFYDFFYNVVYWASWLESSTYPSGTSIIANLAKDNGTLRRGCKPRFPSGSTVLQLLPSADAHTFEMGKGLEAAILAQGGLYTVKELDEDDVGIALSFRE
jgi:hypothetical protein